MEDINWKKRIRKEIAIIKGSNSGIKDSLASGNDFNMIPDDQYQRLISISQNIEHGIMEIYKTLSEMSHPPE